MKAYNNNTIHAVLDEITNQFHLHHIPSNKKLVVDNIGTKEAGDEIIFLLKEEPVEAWDGILRREEYVNYTITDVEEFSGGGNTGRVRFIDKVLGRTRRFDMGGVIEELFEKEEEGSLRDYMINVITNAITPVYNELGEVTHYEKTFYAPEAGAIADGIISVDNIILSYTKTFPLQTIMNEWVFFRPDARHRERKERELDSYIIYAGHLVSGKKEGYGESRHYDSSKERGLEHIMSVFRDRTVKRFRQINKDNTISYIYYRLLKGKRYMGLVIKAEISQDGEIRFVSLMPDLKKEKAGWIPAQLPLLDQPHESELPNPTVLPSSDTLTGNDQTEGKNKDTQNIHTEVKKNEDNSENTDNVYEKLSTGGGLYRKFFKNKAK